MSAQNEPSRSSLDDDFDMDVDAEYLYRGTTLGWSGTYASKTVPITCTTTDPLVATLFALECTFEGHAVVHLAKRSSVESFIGPSNYFAEIELAVNLRLRPLDFLRYVTHTVDASDAREILWERGFDQVPLLVYGIDVLRNELFDAAERPRLSSEQIREFNLKALERRS